jgi:hypothetical protein
VAGIVAALANTVKAPPSKEGKRKKEKKESGGAGVW